MLASTSRQPAPPTCRRGPLPSRSTGYWRPVDELTLYHVNDKPRYRWTGGGDLRSIRYVGLAEPEPAIPAG